MSSSGFSEIISRKLYEDLFPNRAPLYDYDSLITATQIYPQFCSVGSTTDKKREAAAFSAHLAHETEELQYIEELNTENWDKYCDINNSDYPCVSGQTYHGRGPIQISWNYNYGAAGKELDINLLSNPDLVKTDGVVAFKTALWFWMTPQPPKPSAHEVITGIWQPSDEDIKAGRRIGFGTTINIINGGLECGNGRNEKADRRISFYKRFSQLLKVTGGEHLSCDSMQPY